MDCVNSGSSGCGDCEACMMNASNTTSCSQCSGSGITDNTAKTFLCCMKNQCPNGCSMQDTWFSGCFAG
jgi:hypothetical protein